MERQPGASMSEKAEGSDTTPSQSELEAVPIFPLPRIVLFPGARLPLHIFEPRYRQMMEDCNESEGRFIAVARLTGDWKREYHGDPAFDPIAGVGRIAKQLRNDDGTFDIELEGVARARLEELPKDGRAYRRARASLLRDRLPKGDRYKVTQADTSALYTLALQVAAEVQKREPRFVLLAAPDDPAPRLVDRITDQFIGDPDVRQDLLETLDVKQRFAQVSSRLSHLQLALLASEQDDDDDDEPRTLH